MDNFKKLLVGLFEILKFRKKSTEKFQLFNIG